MSEELVRGIITVLLAITGVAIIAALVSKQAQTPQVLQAGGNAFSSALGTALGPITGYTPSNSSFGGVSLPTLQ